ncbi:MAG: V-type ATPase subunit subunit G family protein [Actinomycetota bacterium]
MAKTEQQEPVVVGTRPPETSPLLIIQQKEVEINSGVLQAKRHAEETVAKARMKAVEIRDQAEKKGAEEALALNKKEAAKAKKEAERKKASASAESDKVRETGRKNGDKAVSLIVNVVTGRSS